MNETCSSVGTACRPISGRSSDGKADLSAQEKNTHAQKSSTVSNLEMRRKFSVQLLLLSFLKYHRAHLRRGAGEREERTTTNSQLSHRRGK